MKFSRRAIEVALSGADNISAAAYYLGVEHKYLSNYIARTNSVSIKVLAERCRRREPKADRDRRRKAG